MLLLNTVIDNTRGMSAAVQKTMLKSIITSLLFQKSIFSAITIQNCSFTGSF
jgi:hypothetical protein